MVQDLRATAQSFVEKDPVFIKNLKKSIEGKKLKKTLVLCSNKALWWQKNKGNMNDLETMRFAFEIFSSVFDKMEMPADLRKKMASTVKKKLIAVGKKRMKEKESHPPKNKQKTSMQKRPKKFSSVPNGISKGTITESAPKKRPKIFSSDKQSTAKSPEPATPKKSPKIFSSKSSPPDQSAKPVKKKPKIFSKGTLGKDDSSSVEPSNNQTQEPAHNQKPQQQSQTLSRDEKLKRERERLRQQRQKKRQELAKKREEEEKKLVTVSFDPADKIKEWLRGDEDFWYIVENIRKLPKNTLRIKLDPESEGIIPHIDIRYGIKKYGHHNIIRIRCKADVGTKYPYNIAFGKKKTGLFGKDYIAYSFPEEIPKNRNEALKQIKNVNLKDQLDWDRAMVILNNDKFLQKAIKKLELENPAPGVEEEILIPIRIKKDVPHNKILVETYLSLKLDPWTLFVDLMDQIAEDFFSLRDESGSGSSGSLSKKFESLKASKKDMSGHQFHFLESDEAVSIKTCPHCGKPFPNPDADYRRCPHCLGKLK